MGCLGVGQDFQRFFLERIHKEGPLPENNPRRTEPELSPIQARVEMIQRIVDSSLASSCLSQLKETSPSLRLALINSKDPNRHL